MKERRTVQKDMIYTALQELHNHPTAEQVCAHVRRRCPTISRATVYRVLNGMAEKGSVLRIPVNMHNVPDEKVYRPHSWAAFGTDDKQAADYAACKQYGPLYR